MNGRRRINVAVVGDRGVGKTSLITSAAQEVFSERPVPVLPPTRFPADFAVVSEPVDVIAYDTSSRPEDAQAVDETIKAADVVIVCFDAQRRSTLQRLRSDWLPRITHLRPAAPVIIACCKDDTEETLPTEQIREVGLQQAICMIAGSVGSTRSAPTWQSLYLPPYLQQLQLLSSCHYSPAMSVHGVLAGSCMQASSASSCACFGDCNATARIAVVC